MTTVNMRITFHSYWRLKKLKQLHALSFSSLIETLCTYFEAIQEKNSERVNHIHDIWFKKEMDRLNISPEDLKDYDSCSDSEYEVPKRPKIWFPSKEERNRFLYSLSQVNKTLDDLDDEEYDKIRFDYMKEYYAKKAKSFTTNKAKKYEKLSTDEFGGI